MGDHPARAQDVADPALISVEGRQARRDLVADPRPGSDLELVAIEDPDRRGVRPQDAHRLVDDRPEQLLAVVRRGQPLGDPEDGVEPFRELDLERTTLGGRHRGQRLALGAQEGSEE